CFAKAMERFENARLFPLLTQGCVETCQRVWSAESPSTSGTASGRKEAMDRAFRKGTGLQIESLQSLEPGRWLSGKIIDEMLKISCDDADVNAMKCRPLSTSVFERICDGRTTQKEKKRLREDLSSTEYLLLPMHENGNHWTLAVINTKNHSLVHYESLERNTKPACRLKTLEKIASFMEKLLPATEGKWRKELLPCPQQPNSADCGVYVILNAIHFAAGLPMYYEVDAANYWRYRAVSQLISGSFKLH
ncbi:hypothetical protein PENTCL1PPCAC_23865, partial [Pristionchus entomophagus]